MNYPSPAKPIDTPHRPPPCILDRDRRCWRSRGLRGVVIVALLSLTLAGGSFPSIAQESPPADQKTRTLYVPFDDLQVLLEGQTERVFMTRDEYELLRQSAELAPEVSAPRPYAFRTSRYEAEIDGNEARILGELEIEILNPGLHEIPLEFQGVHLLSAQLDGTGAPIYLDGNGTARVLVQGEGEHRLTLETLAPVSVAAAEQSIQLRLPMASTGQLSLTVPGNVEIKSGAEVVSRVFDEPADQTRFDLVPQRGNLSLVMSLNNKMLREEQLLTSRSVVVSEITSAYERLHGTVSFDILHGAVDRFMIRMPVAYQVTKIENELIDHWRVAEQVADEQVIEIQLREPTRESTIVRWTAIRTPIEIGAWSMPLVTPLDVAGTVSVLGVVSETRLMPRRVETTGLIPLNTDILLDALPPSVMEVEPGAPEVRPVVAFYAPSDTYTLNASLYAPANEVAVTTHLLLSVADQGLQVDGGFSFSPSGDKQRHFDFWIPTNWHVDQIRLADGQPLETERIEEGTRTRVHVNLPSSIHPGETTSIFFHAHQTPDGWLDPWATQQLEFPRIEAVNASTRQGAIAIRALDDLSVLPTESVGLTPLDASARSEFGLAGSLDDVAYEFGIDEYNLRLDVQRAQPWLASRNYSFFEIGDGVLRAHYEVVFDVQRARVREVELMLPSSTPTTIAFIGGEGVQVKESLLTEEDDQHRWLIRLNEPVIGRFRLIGSFEQKRDSDGEQTFDLPIIRAEGVSFQNEMVAVEGSSELDIEVETQMRSVDVGELAEAHYLPGSNLLGAFDSVDADASVAITAEPRALRGLPPAIVQRAELVTMVSTNGRNQTAARYLLRTKVSFVEIELPNLASLWAVMLDGQPVKPQRHGDAILLTLQTDQPQDLRDLQIVYEAPIQPIGLTGRIDAVAPRLLLKDVADEQGRIVPQADLVWHLHLPRGYDVSRTHGTVFRETQLSTDSPVERLADATSTLGGGHRRGWLVPEVQMAQEAATLNDDSYDGATPYTADEEGDVSETPPDNMAPLPPAGAGAAGGYEDRRDSPFADPSEPMQDSDSPARESIERSADPEDSPQGNDGGQDSAGRPGNHSRNGQEPGFQPDGYGGDDSQVDESDDDGDSSSGSGDGSPSFELAQENVGKYWAMQGLGSLAIELAVDGEMVTFNSVGDQPVLDATIVHRGRMNALAWAAAIAVIVGGLLLDRLSYAVKCTYVVVCVTAALGLPLIGGQFVELDTVCDYSLYASLLLIPIFIVSAFLQSIYAMTKRNSPADAEAQPPARSTVTVTLLAVCLFGAVGNSAVAQDIGSRDNGPPVAVPEDALIIPYDPTDADGRAAADQVLVPFSEYQRLWAIAYPDDPIAPSVNQSYALAGSSFQATIGGGNDSGQDAITVRGDIEIEVYVDGQEIQIPLALRQAVITDAQLDGEPARLRAIVGTEPVDPSAVKTPAGTLPPVMTLGVTGKGRHRLQLELRVSLDRQGGWLNLDSHLPIGPAAELMLTVVDAETQIRISDGQSQRSLATEGDSQQVRVPVGIDGGFRLAWRPSIDEGTIDQSLTVDSQGVLDIREDGLRLYWKMQFEFGRNERGSFRFQIPSDFVVESVTGTNVRGFEVLAGDDGSDVDVILLKAVRQSESIEVVLSQRNPIQEGQTSQFDAPYITVNEAALHRGVLAIRRSPILEIRTLSTDQVARTSNDALPTDMGETLRSSESPLGQQLFQAFRFNATGFRIVLESKTAPNQSTARFQAVIRLGETEASFESQYVIQANGRGLYQLNFEIPADMEVREVLMSGSYLWSVDEADQGAAGSDGTRKTLRIFLADVRNGSITVGLRGELPEHSPNDVVDLPRIALQESTEQTGTWVVQVDPSLEVVARDLIDAQVVLLAQAHTWLTEQQRGLAQLAIGCESAAYAGTLALQPKTPRVLCDAITNVRLTYRAIEETILLDFQIEEAGVREIRFRLPARLQDAYVMARMVRHQSRAPVEGTDEVEVTLALQDAIMGEYRVVVQNDRGLALGEQDVPIPTIVTGNVNYQYVTLQNAGRDEVVVSNQNGFEALSPGQGQFNALAQVFGGGDFTMAFVLRDEDSSGDFRYATNRRQVVETSGANIGLAETWMVVDGGGGYRAAQMYRIDNRTEPYLEIILPDSARLWTAIVAGWPVKPAIVPGGADNLVRIPLVKTAEGDLDYQVVLKYGGTLGSISAWEEVSFPLMQTENINVEQSQVRLWLPETHHWFNFGGTAVRVAEEAELDAAYLAYQTNQVERLTDALRSSNSFSVTRAAGNLRQFKTVDQSGSMEFRENENWSRNYDVNAQALEQAMREIDQLQSQSEVVVDNRRQLNSLYLEQKSELSRNQVNRLGNNFADATELPGRDEIQVQDFDQGWLSRNGLSNDELRQIIETQTANDEERRGGRYRADLGGQNESAQAEMEEQNSQLRDNVFGGDMGISGGLADSRPIDPLQGQQGGGSSDDGVLDLNQEYSRRLEQQMSQNQRNAPQITVGRQPISNLFNPDSDLDVQLAQDAFDSATPQFGGYSAQSGFSSLDVDLPERGQLYLFTTPRGNVEITARAVDQRTMNRSVNAGWLLGMLVVFGIAAWIVRRVSARPTGKAVCGVVLLVAGTACFLFGYWPWIGALGALTGILFFLHISLQRRMADLSAVSTVES